MISWQVFNLWNIHKLIGVSHLLIRILYFYQIFKRYKNRFCMCYQNHCTSHHENFYVLQDNFVHHCMPILVSHWVHGVKSNSSKHVAFTYNWVLRWKIFVVLDSHTAICRRRILFLYLTSLGLKDYLVRSEKVWSFYLHSCISIICDDYWTFYIEVVYT